MPFIYYLLQLSPLLLLLLLMIVFALLCISLTWLFRKYIRIRVMGSHNEVTGALFACVGGLYSLLLAFVVFLVWDQANDAQQNADMEFSLAKGLYRDIKYLPDTAASAQLMETYLVYVNKLVDEEFPALAKLQPVPVSTREAYNNLFQAIEQMKSPEAYQNARIDEMFRHINELTTYRSLRQLAAGSGIPPAIWIPLMLGGFITLILACMLNIEHLRLHIVMNGLLGAFMAILIYLIVIMDYPFSGDMRVQPTGYLEILQWNTKII